MDQLFTSVFKSLNTTFPQMLDANLAVAKSYNVGLVTYEGGQSFNPTTASTSRSSSRPSQIPG